MNIYECYKPYQYINHQDMGGPSRCFTNTSAISDQSTWSLPIAWYQKTPGISDILDDLVIPRGGILKKIEI